MCPYCEKTFKTNVNCKKHMKTHIGSLTAQNPIGDFYHSLHFNSGSIEKVFMRNYISLFNTVYFLLRKIPTRYNYRESCQSPQ